MMAYAFLREVTERDFEDDLLTDSSAPVIVKDNVWPALPHGAWMDVFLFIMRRDHFQAKIFVVSTLNWPDRS